MIDFKLNYLPYMDASIYPGFSVDIYSYSNGVNYTLNGTSLVAEKEKQTSPPIKYRQP
jgi:hypothetical protein